MPEYLTAEQLGECFGICGEAIRYHERKGRITCVELGRKKLYHKETVIAQLTKPARKRKR